MSQSLDTIAAIATAMGEASIAVIRVSGPEAVDVVDRIFRGKERLSSCKSHTVHYGKIVSLEGEAALDEVLVTLMRAPRTYTTEDVVEVSTHGGWQAVQAVLAEFIRAGARLAMPGEFTKRAFLHGRIDLSQAEGIMELIAAQTNLARKAALRQVQGSLKAAVQAIRQAMLEVIARIEVTIDYPEHDEEQATADFVLLEAQGLHERVNRVLQEAANGRILRDGVRLAIIGKPNVGKSSLLNTLVKTDRAIVTDIPGTTRDVIEERVEIAGIPFYVVDTAGIRETDDVVEKIGVKKSKEMLAQAEVVIVVVDGNRPLDETDDELIAVVRDRQGIVLVNKADLPIVVDVRALEDRIGPSKVMLYSTRMKQKQVEFEQVLKHMVAGSGEQVSDAPFIASNRHIVLIEEARSRLQDVIQAVIEGQTLDCLAVDLQQAWTTLGEVIGETPREDLLDQIFSQFCLGK